MRINRGFSAVALALALGASLAAGSASAANDNVPAAPPPVTGPQPAAPPPVTGPAVVVVQPVRPADVERARWLFFGAQIGPDFTFGCGGSVCGSSFGAWGNVLVGLAFYNGLSLALALGARADFTSRVSSTGSFLDLTLGARARYSAMQRRRFHPFVQLSGDAHYGGNSDLLAGVGLGGGFEIDFSRHFSGEIGVKADVIFPIGGSSSASSGLAFAVLPFLGFNYYR